MLQSESNELRIMNRLISFILHKYSTTQLKSANQKFYSSRTKLVLERDPIFELFCDRDFQSL